jgi:hypothetical protein
MTDNDCKRLSEVRFGDDPPSVAAATYGVARKQKRPVEAGRFELN